MVRSMENVAVRSMERLVKDRCDRIVLGDGDRLVIVRSDTAAACSSSAGLGKDPTVSSASQTNLFLRRAFLRISRGPK